MKKILMLLLVMHANLYPKNEQDSSVEFLLKSDEHRLSEEHRALPKTTSSKNIPVVNFSKPLVFNPNSTQYPTQPAQITDIRNLLVYVVGAYENGPFGSSQNALTQINAINNNNIGFVNVMNLFNLQNLITNQMNNNQNTGNSGTVNTSITAQNSLTQGAANQSASIQSASSQGGFTTGQLNTTQNTSQNTNQNNLVNQFANVTPNQIITQTTTQSTNQTQTNNLTMQQLVTQLANQTTALSAAGIASSGINGTNFGGISNTNVLNQISSIQSAMNNTTQAITQTNTTNPSSTASVSQSTIPGTQVSTITNPNPFITINNPVLTPKSVVWNSPLIIDSNNHFFDTQSTVTLEENIVFNPGARYTYPEDYVNYPAAIIIGKSNITIDLNGFNLSLAPASAPNFLTNKPIHGIAIMPGVQNIKIISNTPFFHSASISNFSGYGVYGNGYSKNFNAVLAQTVYNIHQELIQNILVENVLMYANLGGISLTNVLQATINYVGISYSFGNQDVYGINFNKVFNGVIMNSKINQNYSNSNIIGIQFMDTIGTLITDSLVDNNRSIKGNATGILISSSTGQFSRDNKIVNCNASINTCGYVAGMESIGINITGESFNNLVQDCTVASNSYGLGLVPPSTLPESYGIKLNTTFKNIIANNTVAFHHTCGIIDTATLSTSLFNRNICIFNSLNYSAQVSNGVTVGGIPLPTTIVYPGNLTAYSGGGPIWQNIDARLS